MERHRKRRKSYNEPGHAHFLTYSCFQRLPLLSKDRSRRWMIDAIEVAREKLDFDVWAYVIMPEHVHLLIWPREREYEISRILAALKRPVSAKAKQHLIETNATDWLSRLTIERSGRPSFRFWQAGGGFDENLWNDRPVERVIDYIHANPVRHGLVERPTDWEWSSARWYAGERDVSLRIDQVKC